MTDRAAFIQGLRTLADLLADHPDMELPYDGTTMPLSIYFRGENAVTQAVQVMQMMTEQPTVEISQRNWLDVTGHLHDLAVSIHMNAQEVCERRVTDVYRATDGSVHEVNEWTIPAELRTPPTVRGGPELDPASEDEYRAEQADYDAGSGQ